jgi:hypothetical protein
MASKKPTVAELKEKIRHSIEAGRMGDALEATEELAKLAGTSPPKKKAAAKPKRSAPKKSREAGAKPQKPQKAIDLPDLDTTGAVLLDIPSSTKSNKPDIADQFRVQPNPTAPDGRKFMTSGKVQTGVKKNTFRPNKKDAVKELEEDRQFWEGKEPTSRGDRGEVDVRRVKVKCDRCERTYEAEPWDVDRRVAGDDERMDNVCPRCFRS